MRAFDVLNKLGDLEEISWHTHHEAPDAIFALAWDERSQNMVCWIIFDHIKSHHTALMARGVAAWIAEQADKAQGIDPALQHDWCYGYAYVTSRTEAKYFPAVLAPQRITPDEYQRIVAEARA